MKRCRQCAKASVVQSVEDRPLDSLPSVCIKGLKVSRCSACGVEAVSIPRFEQLHEVVAKALIRKPGLLNGAEVRYLRKWLGWSARDLAQRFDLSPEHISRIENDHYPISVVADHLLRMLVLVKTPMPDYSPEDILDVKPSNEAFRLGVFAGEAEWQAVA